ncbi:MAG TPA: hypothetical protein VJM34_14845 [Novosphingobium sp.]|nr:hypothetical protein [Novosphingobium sp.]
MTIDGECVSAARRSPVRIAELARDGCDIVADGVDALPEGEFSLWIGAIGPLEVTGTRKTGASLSATFKEPLDPRILEHFAVA